MEGRRGTGRAGRGHMGQMRTGGTEKAQEGQEEAQGGPEMDRKKHEET